MTDQPPVPGTQPGHPNPPTPQPGYGAVPPQGAPVPQPGQVPPAGAYGPQGQPVQPGQYGAPQSAQYGAPQPGQYSAQPHQYGTQPGYGPMPTGGSEQENKQGVISLVLGLAGLGITLVVLLVSGWIVPYIMVIGGALGLNFSRKADTAIKQGQANNTGVAKAGKVLAIITLVLGVIAWIAVRIMNG